MAKDKEFQWWSDDVAQFRAESAKKSVSLNEGDRRAERDKFEAKRKQRQAERKSLGLALDPFADITDLPSLEALLAEKFPDPPVDIRSRVNPDDRVPVHLQSLMYRLRARARSSGRQ